MRKKYSLHVTRKKGDRRNSISRKVTKTLLSCPVLPLTTLWQGYRGFLPSFLPSFAIIPLMYGEVIQFDLEFGTQRALVLLTF
jgi:hypothetical protein